MEEVVQEKLRHFFNDDSIVFDKTRFVGGLTNYNYVMQIKGKEYVIRQPGGMTNRMIDRRLEKTNNHIASQLGLNSECVYFDEDSGVKISVYIKNNKNIAQADPHSPANIKVVSKLLKKIHFSPVPFPNHFDWLQELNKYERLVEELNGDFFYDYFTLKKRLVEFGQAYVQNTSVVPCHNDTVPENFIIADDGRAYLVDWEYSGMNDPSWDIAAYILESRLNEEAINYFVTDYYGQFPDPEEILKIKYFMMAQDLLWTVWALIRHYNGDDFVDYCYFRYDRFRKNIKAFSDSPDYPLAEMVQK